MKKFLIFILILIVISLIYFSIQLTKAVACGGSWCEGDVRKYQYCARRNETTGECIECVTDSENCNNYDKWKCGCPRYREDKYRCFEDWYCGAIAYGGACLYEYKPIIYCGASTDSDGGDVPTKQGIAVDKYCSNSECRQDTYVDYCSGICSRSEQTEYFVNNDRVNNKVYPDLFSKNQYCKNGEIYEDKSKPSPSLSAGGANWRNSDFTDTLICNDHDESGCYKYYYRVVRVL